MSATPSTGEAAPSERLTDALTHALRDSGELHGEEHITELEQLSGGWSRQSYVAGATLDGDRQRRYIVRVQAPGVLETELEIEYRVYDVLSTETELPTPRVYHFDGGEDNAFGHPYMVMEHLQGVAPNAFRRSDRQWLQEDWEGPRRIARDLVNHVAVLHTFPIERLGTGAIPALDFLSVVDRWQTVYEEKHLVRDPVTEEGFAWLRSRVPEDETAHTGVVHGDYRIGNTLVEGGRITAILDWELAYIGDVRFDLGYLALERLAGKHLQPVGKLMNAVADEDWFFEQYAAQIGRPVDREIVRTFSVLGIMMLLSTHYMGLWLYAHGESEDFRLAWNRFGAIGLRQDLTKLMEW